MANNSFGKIFKITTFGESHGKAIGVVIDGCPAGIKIDLSEINEALFLRAPGKNGCTTSRKEEDNAELLSGVFEGVTTGMPITILIANCDANSNHYEPIKDILRPGHANYTYLKKYGIFDYRGGGRASARETACRVAAGVIADKFLSLHGIILYAYIKQIGNIKAMTANKSFDVLEQLTYKSPVYCPDFEASQKMEKLILKTKEDGDSLGGIVEFIALNVPCGLGDPVYEKLEANLANALMSIPASKGFEIGDGFDAVYALGSEHNDLFLSNEGAIETKTNHAGGILGGISTGMPIMGRVAFKPASSIAKPQESINTSGKKITFELPKGSRHDPCVAIRAVPVVKAMCALVLCDAILLNRCSKL